MSWFQWLIVIGLALVVIAVFKIGATLDSILSVVANNSELQEIKEEFQWHKDYTFAHELREWIEEIPKDIEKELQWHVGGTFAHELRDWIETAAADSAKEINERLDSMGASLESIDSKTS